MRAACEMAHKDPEKRREYERERSRKRRENPEYRAWAAEYQRHRRETGVYADREREKRQEWLERNPGYKRRRYLANRDRVLEQAKQWAEANPDRVRANKREYERRLRQQNPDRQRAETRQFGLASRHGMRPEDWAAMWSAQQGRCYLCGEEMEPRKAHIDHDHRCCPRGTSCRHCRRGLACSSCNPLVGLARDDPGRLRKIADNLETALAAVEARLAAKPEQGTLEGIA